MATRSSGRGADLDKALIAFEVETAMPLALYALAAGAFGIGVTEFVIMGLLIEVSEDLGVSISAAGLLISGYALGVVVGAPLLDHRHRQLAAQDRAAWR